jgi:hypothetical protein
MNFKNKYFFIVSLLFLLNMFFIPNFTFASEELANKITIQRSSNPYLSVVTSLSMALSAFDIVMSVDDLISLTETNVNQGTNFFNLLIASYRFFPEVKNVDFYSSKKIESIKKLLNDGVIMTNMKASTKVFATDLSTGKTVILFDEFGEPRGNILTHFDENNNAHIIDPILGKIEISSGDFFKAYQKGLFYGGKKVLPPQFYTFLNLPNWLFVSSNPNQYFSYGSSKEDIKKDLFVLDMFNKDDGLTQTGDSACALSDSTCLEILSKIGGRGDSCKTARDLFIAACKKDGYRESFDTGKIQLIKGVSWYDSASSTEIHSPYTACKQLGSFFYPYKVWDKNGVEMKSTSCDFMGEQFTEGTVLCKTYPEEITNEACKSGLGEQCSSFMEDKIEEEKNPLITTNGVDWCPGVERSVNINLTPNYACYPFKTSVEVSWEVKGYDRCIASGAWNGDKTLGGMETVYVETDLENLSSGKDILVLDCEYKEPFKGVITNRIEKSLFQRDSDPYRIKLSIDPASFSNTKELPATTTLSWSARDTGLDCDQLSCNITGANFSTTTTGCNISGTTTLNFDDPGNYLYQIKCQKPQEAFNCGPNREFVNVFVPPPLPVVNLEVNPNPAYGEGDTVSVNITLNSKYADTCTGSWTEEAIATSSTYVWSTDKNGKYDFSVTCKNSVGETIKTVKDIEMYLKPKLTVVLPSNVIIGNIKGLKAIILKKGESATIEWSTKNADACTNPNDLGNSQRFGIEYLSGSKTFSYNGYILSNYISEPGLPTLIDFFVISCSGIGGRVSERVSIGLENN